MKRKIFCTLALLLGMLVWSSSAFAASDLPKNHVFYEEITYLMDKRIVAGYPDGTVQPSRLVTRAQTAVMISRLKGFDHTQKTTPFSDVPKSHSASGSIAEVVEAGLMTGFPGGTFKPNSPINRGDMAIILQRVFGLGMRMGEEFTDVSQNMKAYGPIENLLAASITIGYPDGTFRPLANVTRGQFSAFLARGLEPKFQNKVAIPNTYLRDKTKTYVMIGGNDTLTYVYKKHSLNTGMAPEFMWVISSKAGSLDTAIVERESFTSYKLGFPYSETYDNLVYPVAKGETFFVDNEGGEPELRTITGVNKTVATPYKTFTNATEVTGGNGMKYYYAKSHGPIKTLDPNGKVILQLAEVR